MREPAPPVWRRYVEPAFLVALLFVPLLTDKYTQYVCNLVLVYALVGIGLNLLLGYAGQFAFAHAAFMGIGAYSAALLTTRLGVPFWISLPAAGVIAMMIGAIAVLPALRMKRVYLALATIAFAELVTWVLVHWKAVTLGTDGVDLKAPYFFGWRIGSDNTKYFVLLAVTAIMYLFAKRILQSKIGRAFVAIRENEIVAQCNGIDVARTKTIAFALSAFYAGIGGALFALTLGFIVPDGFGLGQIALHFSIVVIGGLASLPGSLIGAVLVTILPEALRGLQGVQELVYGLTLMLFILFMPSGIAGLLRKYGLLPREILAAPGWREQASERRHAGPPAQAAE